jgi:hypothetical protein
VGRAGRGGGRVRRHTICCSCIPAPSCALVVVVVIQFNAPEVQSQPLRAYCLCLCVHARSSHSSSSSSSSRAQPRLGEEANNGTTSMCRCALQGSSSARHGQCGVVAGAEAGGSSSRAQSKTQVGWPKTPASRGSYLGQAGEGMDAAISR